MEYYQCFARKNSNKQAMLDVFMRDWYATSPYLHDVGIKSNVKCHCTILAALVVQACVPCSPSHLTPTQESQSHSLFGCKHHKYILNIK